MVETLSRSDQNCASEISDTDEPNKPKMGTYAQSDSLAAEEGAGSTGGRSVTVF